MKTPRVSDIVGIINRLAPFRYAEEWDNVGLQVGDPALQANRIMVALDPGKAAVEAAVTSRCNVLLAHHPLLFKPLKKISFADPVGALIHHAIKNNLSIIALHTNFDIAAGGINDLLANLLGVTSCLPLKVTGEEELVKLSVFVPAANEEQILEALFRFSGILGNYRDCSFRSGGVGTFTPMEGANPYLGQVGKREHVEEMRIEVLLRKADVAAAVAAMVKAHPYEEPAYDLYPLLNKGTGHGLGRIGLLSEECSLESFAARVRDSLCCNHVRMVGSGARMVRKVAVCGGSGAFLLKEAIRQGADVLVTGDVKYHDAREAESLGIGIIDAGHFATEKPMIAGFAKALTNELKKSNFVADVLMFQGEQEPFSRI